MGRDWKTAAMVVGLALATPLSSAGQGAPKATVLGGFGNALGWFGGQLEGYVARGRLSGFAGLGYMPNLLNDAGDGLAGALGVRAFTAGTRHRGLLEVSLTALSTSVSSTFGGGVLDVDRSYGPGLAAGYQFVGEGGLTILLTGGAGLDDQALDPEGSRVRPTLGIGLGYTWR